MSQFSNLVRALHTARQLYLFVSKLPPARQVLFDPIKFVNRIVRAPARKPERGHSQLKPLRDSTAPRKKVGLCRFVSLSGETRYVRGKLKRREDETPPRFLVDKHRVPISAARDI